MLICLRQLQGCSTAEGWQPRNTSHHSCYRSTWQHVFIDRLVDWILAMRMMLPVKYHSELLAKQYWLSCFQSHQPCHHLTTLPAPARNMKGTLMKFNNEVILLSYEGITDVDTYHDCLSTLHSQAVCCLGRSAPHLSSCVLVTVGSWTLTRPASPAVYQIFVQSVEWYYTP